MALNGVQVAGEGGSSGSRGPDGTHRARLTALGLGPHCGFFCVAAPVTPSQGLNLCCLPVPSLLVFLAQRLQGLDPSSPETLTPCSYLTVYLCLGGLGLGNPEDWLAW